VRGTFAVVWVRRGIAVGFIEFYPARKDRLPDWKSVGFKQAHLYQRLPTTPIYQAVAIYCEG
jgi:hypothetical protein